MTQWRQRAERFPLPFVLCYCISGARDWSSGRTQNISGSGVLFAADRQLAIGTQIELRVAMEADGKSYPSEVVARARIVRVVAPQSQTESPAIAASFEAYELLPRKMGNA